MRYVFADCVLDTRRYVLTGRAGARAAPQSVPRALVPATQPARVVPKHEVAAQVWPDAFTSDTVIESTIKAVRQALGDSGRTQRYIQTLRGYGYRVVVEVTVCPETAADGDGGAAAAPRGASPAGPHTMPRLSPPRARGGRLLRGLLDGSSSQTRARRGGVPPAGVLDTRLPPWRCLAGERQGRHRALLRLAHPSVSAGKSRP